jgi:hypothetical protein
MAISKDTTLYVLSCQGRVTGYARKANGNVMPDRLPTGFELAEAMAYGLVVGELDTLYVSKNWMSGRGAGGYIDVYVPGTSNRKRRLKGFGLGYNGLVGDKAGRLYRGKPGGFDLISPSGWDDSSRVGELVAEGGETELYWPGNFAMDSHGNLVVPNLDDAIRVYGSDTTHNLRPIRRLSGRRTELDGPIAAAIGPGDTLFVANRGPARGPSVTIYRPGATGDEAPVRRLAGDRTGLQVLRALAVDRSGRLYVLNNPEMDVEYTCGPKVIL